MLTDKKSRHEHFKTDMRKLSIFEGFRTSKAVTILSFRHYDSAVLKQVQCKILEISDNALLMVLT